MANSLGRFLFAWEADSVVHCLGDKNQDSCALQHSDLSPPRCSLLCGKNSLLWLVSRQVPVQCCTSLQQLLIHLAFPQRPALVSRQMTQFDMPLGWFMWIMFPCDHHCRKETISCYVFFFSSLSLTITGILGEFIARRLKLIISARHSKYKRNYVMVFCPGP